MESKEIKELIELVSRSDLRTVELERNGFRIKLVKSEGGPPARVAVAAGPPAPQASPEATGTPPAADEPGAVDTGLHELHSPIVGTFYSAPGPDLPDFVEVGARVTQGQTMCIIEAMKVMNEIESEIAGEVVEILVKNGQPVEFGEVMFRLRPA